MVEQRFALVTASTVGMGRETAVALAANGFHVILHGRSPDRLRDAREWVLQRCRTAQVETLRADLQVLSEVRAAVADLGHRVTHLDVLVNNAEIYPSDPHLTVDGWESTFAVNHIAPFVLTMGLLPLLKRAPAARVVNVSNAAHSRGHIIESRLRSLDHFDAYQAFADSKLANLLFTSELQRREPTLAVNALHPGSMPTRLLTESFGTRGPDTLVGRIDTSVWLATAPDAGRLRGAYCVQSKPTTASTHARDEELAATLWRISESAL